MHKADTDKSKHSSKRMLHKYKRAQQTTMPNKLHNGSPRDPKTETEKSNSFNVLTCELYNNLYPAYRECVSTG